MTYPKVSSLGYQVSQERGSLLATRIGTNFVKFFSFIKPVKSTLTYLWGFLQALLLGNPRLGLILTQKEA
jgi:hypothetical protein